MKIFISKCLIFFLFLLKNRLWVHVRTASASTYNLCFGAKIRKLGIRMHTPVLLYKSGVQWGIYYTDMFSCCRFVLNHDLSLGIRWTPLSDP